MKKNEEGNVSIMVLFGLAFAALVAAVFIYEKRSDNDFTKFKNAAEGMRSEVESVNKKLDELSAQNKKLLSDIEAAHGQADAAKSKAEVAEALAHKVAIDVAKRPAQSVGAQTPIKVEPIRVVIYDRRQLKKATNSVKPLTPEQKVIKSVKQKMKTLSN